MRRRDPRRIQAHQTCRGVSPRLQVVNAAALPADPRSRLLGAPRRVARCDRQVHRLHGARRRSLLADLVLRRGPPTRLPHAAVLRVARFGPRARRRRGRLLRFRHAAPARLLLLPTRLPRVTALRIERFALPPRSRLRRGPQVPRQCLSAVERQPPTDPRHPRTHGRVVALRRIRSLHRASVLLCRLAAPANRPRRFRAVVCGRIRRFNRDPKRPLRR